MVNGLTVREHLSNSDHNMTKLSGVFEKQKCKAVLRFYIYKSIFHRDEMETSHGEEVKWDN